MALKKSLRRQKNEKREKIEMLEQWAAALEERASLIVVEGKKDKAALASLGVVHVVTLGKEPLYSIAEKIASTEKEVVILTDFDAQGRILYHILKELFERLGVRVDPFFRLWLRRHTNLSHIEGIATYFEHHL